MAWCPVCKSEYIEGKISCNECKVPLVDNLEVIEKDCVENDSLPNKSYESNEDSTSSDMTQETQDLFMERELAEAIKKAREPAAVYQKKSEQADDHKSSANTLIVLGFLGLITILLFAFDLIPFLIGYSNKILVVSVMGSVFAFLVFMGFSSLKSYKKLAKESAIENNLEKDIKEWCQLNITSNIIEETRSNEIEYSEEELYFKRIEKIKEIISLKYMNLEEGFLDKLADDLYSEIYE